MHWVISVWRDERLPRRFWDKVQWSDSSGCWLWVGAVAAHGYGRTQDSVLGKVVYAHRLAYTTLIAPVAPDLVLDHLCSVRSCVNPHHLEPVTTRENLLRGRTIARANAAKTHCPRGHEYTDDNTYWHSHRTCRPTRICRTCHRADMKRRRTANVDNLSRVAA